MYARWTFLQVVPKSALLLLFSAWMLSAQTGLGIVRGTVTDPSNAVAPDARVVLLNTATGVGQSTTTSAAGVYYFGSVPIGSYKLMIECAGFKKWTGDVTLEAGQTLVVDATMQVGAPDTVIEVTDAAPVVTTEGAQVSDVKDAQRIHQLPLNGRYVTNLFLLTPGVEDNSTPGPQGQTGGSPRVNGMKAGSAEMLLDGVSLVSRFGGGMVNVQPGLDTIQEYRIETAGSNAQYSRPATVALVTKSGTNQIHGSVFETHRNNFGGLRARQRQDSSGNPPQYIRNEYGASAGGPIIKNKAFWFVSYEGQKQRMSKFAQAQAPTDALWNGDFSGATDSDGMPITIYDPLTTTATGTRLPFSGNRIPQDRLSAFATSMKSISAKPTKTVANPFTDVNFSTYYPNKYDSGTLTAKIDQVFSGNDNVSGRFTRAAAAQKLLGGRYGYPQPGSTNAGGTGRQDSTVYSIFTRWNHVFTPTLLNELQASGHRAPNDSGTLADGTNWANQLGLPNPFGVTGWPTIYTDAPFFDCCWDSDNRKNQMLTAYQLEDNVTWVAGKHTLRFGFKGRKEFSNVREMQQAQGSHGFYRDWTALYDPAGDQASSFTGSGFASMLLGLPTELSNQYNRGYFYFRQMELGAYAQDSWRLSPRLTLDFGLRWDKWTVYKEKYDRLVNLDLNRYATGMEVITPGNTTMESLPGVPPAVLESWTLRGLTWKTANQAGFPSSLLPSDNNNFAPRLGVAYRLSDKTVLRAGYGIYYWTMPLSQILQSSRQNPPLNLVFKNNLSNRNGTNYNYAMKNAPASNDFVGQAAVDTSGVAGIGQDAQGMMPWDVRNWSDNMAQNWTFTIERELMRETAVRLSYIGNHGSNLEQRWLWNSPEPEWNYQARTGLLRPTNIDLRRPNPNWSGGIVPWDLSGGGGSAAVLHNGYSSTHSLQAEVDRRFSNGLGFQWFYAFSRVMTTTDADGTTSGTGGVNNIGKGDGTSTTFTVPESVLLMGKPNLSSSELLRLGYANASSVPAHRIRWNGIYDLPFGKGKRFGRDASRAVDLLMGGWQLSFNGSWRSGFWMGVAANKYLFGDPTLAAGDRLEMNIFGKHQRLWFRGYFDPTKATDVDAAKLQRLVPVDGLQRIYRPAGPNLDNRLPQTLADGTERYTPITDMVNWNAKNFFRGPGAWNQDMSIFKNIPIGERFRIRLTADFFNVLNHPVDMAPDQTSGLQDLSRQSNDPRIVQFSARIEW